ncbi:MAG: hypothetical protein K5857_05640 [Lachnospiraceae bacterium]|nr:hypothetical protein [Lachnospiraceae bacterium]
MAEKLSNSDLGKVSGGFTEDNIGYNTFGATIVCPNCHSDKRYDIEYKETKDILNPNGAFCNYYCRNCNTAFYVQPTS